MALLPPPEVLDEVAAAIPREKRPQLRWIDPALWHVTLAFLGEVPDQVLPELHVRLSRAASRYTPMTLSFSGAGAFPSPARARIFWLGLTADPERMADPGRMANPADPERTEQTPARRRRPGLESLKRLAASVAAGAQRAGAGEADRKPFHPHLTLARARPGDDLRSLVDSMRSFNGLGWQAEAVHLVRSHLGPHVRYEPLSAYPLGGRD